ncbi:MAG: hypothetical protein ABI718_04685 [Acidobacteriota bacterium]
MAIVDIGQLHSRYVRLADRFKALWTYNQLVTSVYKNVLHTAVPYTIDFPAVYEKIRSASDVIQSSNSPSADPLMAGSERELKRINESLLAADQLITPPVLRRFLEQLKRSDDKKIIFYLIKFYLYGPATEGDQRDKLDFLFTRVGEEYLESRGQYLETDPAELRHQVESLVSILPPSSLDTNEVLSLVDEIRGLKNEILRIESFESLTASGLLEETRAFKHRLRMQYFNPDVLLAIIDSNVISRHTFMKFYSQEEQKLLEDSQRLLDSEDAIAHAFGESNPELMKEIADFRELRVEFEDARASFNLKHNLIGRLRTRMDSILARLHDDRGVDQEMSEVRRLEVSSRDVVTRKFGHDPLLHPYLVAVHSAISSLDPHMGEQAMARSPEAIDLRLEVWEISAFFRVLEAPDLAGDEVNGLYVRAAALRLKITEEATFLAAFPPQKPIEGNLLKTIKDSLDRANTYDQQFVSALHDVIHFADSQDVHSLYRSRFRLLRVFAGLWLLYDQFT